MSLITNQVVLKTGAADETHTIKAGEHGNLEILRDGLPVVEISDSKITLPNVTSLWSEDNGTLVSQLLLAHVLPTLMSPVKGDRVLVKTDFEEVAIKAGTKVLVAEKLITFTSQTVVPLIDSSYVPGNDYSVWARPDGTVYCTIDSYSDPATSAIGAVKIGGFHYGLVEIGTTVSSGGFAVGGTGHSWTQADVDKLTGINEHSIWDLNFRPKCDPRGMTCVLGQYWVGIYFCGTEHITQGTSKAGSNVASGTVLPKVPLQFGGNGSTAYSRLSAYEALEIVQSHGKRLITHEEFCSAAYGVTEAQSLGGAATTIPTTLRQNGYTSLFGLEQATGHIWTIGGPPTSVAGTAWATDPGRGSLYGTSGLPLFGGARDNAASSGSRASNWHNVFWNSHWSVGLRAACDHFTQ